MEFENIVSYEFKEITTRGNEEVINEDTTVQEDVVFPSSDETIVTEELIELCLEYLHTSIVLGYDVATLLNIYDESDKEKAEDNYNDGCKTYYPVRVKVLKSLISYPDEEEFQFFFENVQHKALTMAKEAREEQLHHEPSCMTLTEAAECFCDEPVTSTEVLVCSNCNIVVCPSCSVGPCAVALMRFIKSRELDDAAEECDISFLEENEDDEDKEDVEDEVMDIKDIDEELLVEMEISDNDESSDDDREL